MGAPGSFYWAGTVKVLNLTDNTYYKLNDDVIMSRRYTYLGEYLESLQLTRWTVSDHHDHKLKDYCFINRKKQ